MNPVDTLSDDEFANLVQRAVALPDAPKALVRAAIDLWSAKARRPQPKDTVPAAPRLDSAVLPGSRAPAPAVWAVRADASDPRHLQFSALGRDIDLRIVPVAGHFAMHGQVLGTGVRGTVELATNATDVEGEILNARVASLDALGEFRLNGVPGGIYRLTLRTGSDEIVLPHIVVGGSSG